MSRLVKTRGIVVRHIPHSETSRIIHWVTEKHGRISTIAKGAMRPRNQFLGQFDQYYTCELIYYARDRDTLNITREISPLHARSQFRTDWRAMLAAQYITSITSHVSPQNEPVPELYRLLEDALNELEAHGWHPPILNLFELRLLEQLGLAPRLTHCSNCNKTLPAGQSAMFSSKRGGMMCGACGDGESLAMNIGPDILAILNNWQSSKGWSAAKSARCTEKQLHVIRLLLGDFLTYHLDIYPGTRESVLDMLFTEETRPQARKISL